MCSTLDIVHSGFRTMDWSRLLGISGCHQTVIFGFRTITASPLYLSFKPSSCLVKCFEVLTFDVNVTMLSSGVWFSTTVHVQYTCRHHN